MDGHFDLELYFGFGYLNGRFEMKMFPKFNSHNIGLNDLFCYFAHYLGMEWICIKAVVGVASFND